MKEEMLKNDVVKDGYTYSFNKQQIVVAEVLDFLTNQSYWARGITEATVCNAIAHSVCLGVYAPDGRMAGFGRMITDRATFGYLADVFVPVAFRGRGISKQMMHLFCELAKAFGLRRLLLTTQDAHGLYGQFDFVPFPWPERLMLYTPEKQP